MELRVLAAGQVVTLLGARNAVAAVFVLNGFALAGWMGRLPGIRDGLDLTPGRLGLLILVGSVGSLVGLPVAGALAARFGAHRVVATGAVLVTVAQTAAGLAADAGWLLGTAAGLVIMGLGLGVWDVAMNLHGAQVEQRIGRTIMPRFHAAFSFGTVLGAGGAAAASAIGWSVAAHVAIANTVVLIGVLVATRHFLPSVEPPTTSDRPARTAWTEPRTLLIGVMVLALALTEGTANDWLAVALVDGYDVPNWAGAVGFAVFVTAMTAGRLVGASLLDRHGRTPVLWTTMIVAGAGVLLTVWGGHVAIACIGIVLWGLGASLGFPVGMSAAADDPERAAARVSVVSTIGYTAFLAGPPLLGLIGDQVGTLNALLVVALFLLPSAAVVPAAREEHRVSRR